jgi:hypothetical protein
MPKAMMLKWLVEQEKFEIETSILRKKRKQISDYLFVYCMNFLHFCANSELD